MNAYLHERYQGTGMRNDTERAADSRQDRRVLFLAAFAVLFGWHAWISLLYTQPYIFGDELTYKSMASAYFHRGDLYGYTSGQIGHAADLPNFLYQLMISPAFAFEERFLGAIKLMNSLMAASALLPLFLLLREFLPEKPALWISFVALLLPELNYTINVMPENLFFPLFLWAFYLSFKALHLRTLRWLLLSAAASGLLYLTKPHAVAFFAALYLLTGILTLIEALRHNRPAAARYLAGGLIHLAAAAAVIVLMSALFSSRPFGEFGSYSHMAADMLNQSLFDEPKPFLRMVAAHLCAIGLLYFLPVMALLFMLVRGIRENDSGRALFAALLLLAALFFFAMVVKFTHVISGQEHYARLHQRYYYFFFPLLISAFFIHHRFIREHRPALLALFALMVPSVYYVLYTGYIAGNAGLITDAPGLVWLLALYEQPWTAAVSVLYVAAFVSVLLMKRSAEGYGALLIAYVILSNLAFIQESLRLHHANALRDYDVTRKIAQKLSGYTGTVTVVDSSFPKRMNLVFWTDLRYKAVRELPAGRTIDAGLAGGADAVVLLDSYPAAIDVLRSDEIRHGGKTYRILYVNHPPKENRHGADTAD